MRLTLVLCDRCRSEMPVEQKTPELMLEAAYMPVGRRSFRGERHRLELCAACRGAFAQWLGPAATPAGLTATDMPAGPPLEAGTGEGDPAGPSAVPPAALPEGPVATVLAGPRRKRVPAEP